ncbi:MAG: hypothetical protein ACXU8N_02070 [Telluria sp.]
MKNAILKNMEALFLASLVLIGFANYAAAKMPSHHASKPAIAAQADGNLYTVRVSAKRLPKTIG